MADKVKFCFIWSCHISNLEGRQFNQSVFSPAFRTVHNNLGIDWRLRVTPAGGSSSRKKYSENLGFYLEFVPGLFPSVELSATLFIDYRGQALKKMSYTHKFPNETGDFYWGFPKFLPIRIEEIRNRGLIENNILKFGVIIDIPNSQFTWENMLKEKEEKIWNRMHSRKLDFTELFSHCQIIGEGGEVVQAEKFPANYSQRTVENTRKYLDFKIKTKDGKEILCHKIVLGTKSSYFETMFFSEMKEAKKGEVTFEKMDSDTMLELLHFIYKDEISENFQNLDLHSLLDSASLFDLADLKLTCYKKLMEEELKAEKVAELLELADLYSFKVLKERCLNFASENVPAVRESEGGKKLHEVLWKEIWDVSKKRICVKEIPMYFSLNSDE